MYQVNGAQLIYKSLLKHHVRDVFLYSGGSVMPIIDQFYKSPINYYINSHEQNGAHSATGYSKTSNKTGVCIVTSGPGFTNTITPMLDATNDSTPLLVISGQVSSKVKGTNAFQEAPAVELSKHVCKWSHEIEKISDIPYIMEQAFRIANNGKKGAVHIDVPKDISSGINEEVFTFERKKELDKIMPDLVYSEFMDFNLCKNIIDKINLSEKPIIYLGQGCKDYSYLLRKFAIKGNIPVTSTIHGKGIFNDHDPLSLEWCGMHGHAGANYALQESDCIIAIGSRFDDRTTGNVSKYAPKAKENKGIIHVNIEPNEINRVVKSDYSLQTNCQNFLGMGYNFIKHKNRTYWTERVKYLKSRYAFHMKLSKENENKLYMEDILNRFYLKTIDKEVIFTTGVGNHQMQTYQFIKAQYPKKIISSGSLGVMGSGLPYAIGAQIANPDKLVIDIDGDSSFNMTSSDLKTIKEYNLPVKIAIMNNDSQQMVNVWEELYFDKRYTATINHNNPDYVKLAESYGIKALECSNVTNLNKTITEFINYDGPILCEFKVKKGYCLPLVGPGKALDEMILPGDRVVSDGLEAPS